MAIDRQGIKMFIRVGDSTIFATVFGSKSLPTILALGGWIGSGEDWIEPLSILSESWRVASFDHRGSGITISPVESITFDRLIDDIFVVMDALEIETCLLAAMSMGAAVALGAILRHPERFTGLVLVNSLDLREKPSRENDMFLMGLTHDYSGTLDGFINACIPESDSDMIKHWGRQILNRASQESAIALYQLSKTITIGSELEAITLPTLIIHGTDDVIAELESAYWLSKKMPHASLKIIEGAGHVPIMTRPHAVAHEIKDFFYHLSK